MERCIFYLIAKDPDSNSGFKMQQTFFFLISATNCHISECIWFDLFNMSFFKSAEKKLKDCCKPVASPDKKPNSPGSLLAGLLAD